MGPPAFRSPVAGWGWGFCWCDCGVENREEPVCTHSPFDFFLRDVRVPHVSGPLLKRNPYAQKTRRDVCRDGTTSRKKTAHSKNNRSLPEASHRTPQRVADERIPTEKKGLGWSLKEIP